tara:strand:- start:12114 stop:12395 length:282 start_codon:yes stop_codon:yes gene_type:complete
MNDILIMALPFGAGLILGVLFYGGLWWTVQKCLTSAHAPWLFLGSFWLRMALALGGFYIVAQGDWKNILICFAGFMLGRIAVRILTREPSHAA